MVRGQGDLAFLMGHQHRDVTQGTSSSCWTADTWRSGWRSGPGRRTMGEVLGAEAGTADRSVSGVTPRFIGGLQHQISRAGVIRSVPRVKMKWHNVQREP